MGWKTFDSHKSPRPFRRHLGLFQCPALSQQACGSLRESCGTQKDALDNLGAVLACRQWASRLLSPQLRLTSVLLLHDCHGCLAPQQRSHQVGTHNLLHSAGWGGSQRCAGRLRLPRIVHPYVYATQLVTSLLRQTLHLQAACRHSGDWSSVLLSNHGLC